ncbi:carbonic anhydrase [Neisseria chenwenguii]|uniref:Carbonic anhydrase 2 n=1 Tax=Neisseria chenwenguii TaxID=1853278 RepID=A0A220S4C0_9NEIS|nr:carbonic anhydrase [Neisseria chenwenguii]ASK28280.1 carbonic anhydrase [Neisseria chenwenguii]ROV57404.1 carbonic anhydrase [Neisseria chenwenguii]
MIKTREDIFEHNREWAEQQLQNDPHFFDNLAASQNPDYLYIGCSDSRVTAEEMMGMQPGDVFVHRNIANMVNPLDINAASVVGYAVDYLRVKHIVVCGHYNCGGIKAAMQPRDYGALNPWLRNVRDIYRLHREELDAIEDETARYDRLVEINVQEQCVNIIKMAEVQKRYIHEHYPTVHGWVFDIRTGRLKDLQIDFEQILHNIQKIYDLTDGQWEVSVPR